MSTASGYTLDLYCDNIKHGDHHEWKEFPHTYTSDERLCKSICFSRARKHGWLIGKEKTLCPKCSGKKRNPNNDQ